MALPPPAYEDALLYPVTSTSITDIFVSSCEGQTAPRVHKDSLPSYDTACSSADRFHLTTRPSLTSRTFHGDLASPGSQHADRVWSHSTTLRGPELSSPQSSSASGNPQGRVSPSPSSSPSPTTITNNAVTKAVTTSSHRNAACPQSSLTTSSSSSSHDRDVTHGNDITIHITRSQEGGAAGGGCGGVRSQHPSASLLPSSRLPSPATVVVDTTDDRPCRSGSPASYSTVQTADCACPRRASQRNCVVATDIDAASARTLTAGPLAASCSNIESSGSQAGCGFGRAGLGRLRNTGSNLGNHHFCDLRRPDSQQLERNGTNSSQRHEPSALRSSRDSISSPGLRQERSCSDSGVHADSRTRAVAAAASVISSGLLTPQSNRSSHRHHNSHHYQHQHHNHRHHGSHGCIPAYNLGSHNSLHNQHASNRRAHSHSSICRPAAHAGRGHRDHGSTPNVSQSQRASCQEEEVTYVWKDHRVQVQGARSEATTPDPAHSQPGQHVQYVWRNGNVQRVVRGPNNELLSAEVVPPRGEIKGINYYTVFGVIAFVIVAFVILVVVVYKLHN